MKMSERIRRARRKVDLSQTALAARVHVRRSAVSNWESASDIQPSLQNLVAISKVCGISFEWLATGRGAMGADLQLLADIPAADAELVDERDERELLAMYRSLPGKSQQLVLALVETMQAGKRRFKRE
jgi:transcriptional regulator with XRE-family HTH domain